jgi:hypothetical protein
LDCHIVTPTGFDGAMDRPFRHALVVRYSYEGLPEVITHIRGNEDKPEILCQEE